MQFGFTMDPVGNVVFYGGRETGVGSKNTFDAVTSFICMSYRNAKLVLTCGC